ncbi:TRAP-type C4-dicarboxylate transport system permease small subunit [Sulfitobacter undariae]|uniref:TRAP transporter small permease protein n=1 Tax=Sulfitobacter undariae TaxID=1563671 RepID=A0A7W6E4Z4_9RHOB|nr:TRAP transporter small permease [Sulfitobacter undariae]MBB3994853.1 TRAP-type C4-dicarboxylate transport system permease small subunit [Sulfitobacter undariae]
MSALIRLNILLSRLAGGVAAFAVIAMMLIVSIDAFTGKAFDIRVPLVSVIVANYFMVAIAFLPLALAEAEDRHISVDLIYGRLPAWGQRITGIVIHLLSAVTSAGLAWTMWDEAMRRFSSGSVTVENGVSMPIWQGYFLLPLGFAMLSFIYLLRVFLGLAGSEQAQVQLISDPIETASEATQ